MIYTENENVKATTGCLFEENQTISKNFITVNGFVDVYVSVLILSTDLSKIIKR